LCPPGDVIPKSITETLEETPFAVLQETPIFATLTALFTEMLILL